MSQNLRRSPHCNRQSVFARPAEPACLSNLETRSRLERYRETSQAVDFLPSLKDEEVNCAQAVNYTQLSIRRAGGTFGITGRAEFCLVVLRVGA